MALLLMGRLFYHNIIIRILSKILIITVKILEEAPEKVLAEIFNNRLKRIIIKIIKNQVLENNIQA